MATTSSGIENTIIGATVTEEFDGESYDEATSYTIRARISLGREPRDTKWSALLDLAHPQRPYTSAGWESSDQWLDARLALSLEHTDVLEIGEAVLAFANEHGLTP